MRFALLVYIDERAWVAATEAERAELYERNDAVALAHPGVFRGGAELHSTAAATTVRVRDGETLVTDGPYAETKEQLGGLFIVDVPTEEEARAIAAQLPDAELGAIEVRPLVEAAGRPEPAAPASEAASP